MDRSDDNPLKPTKGDHAYTAAKAALAAVPVVGGSAAEVLGALIRPPITKRLEAWCEGISQRLVELERESALDCSTLPANEEFISTVQHATQIAMRTHQEEKLEALRNAVLNVAAGAAPSDDLQLLFLSFVDAFTPWHLRILKFLANPERSLDAAGKTLPANVTLYRAIGEALPNASLAEGLCEQAFLDLKNRSLIFADNFEDAYRTLHRTISREEAAHKGTTELADAFLAFIESPRPSA